VTPALCQSVPLGAMAIAVGVSPQGYATLCLGRGAYLRPIDHLLSAAVFSLRRKSHRSEGASPLRPHSNSSAFGHVVIGAHAREKTTVSSRDALFLAWKMHSNGGLA
jgi:hypothetical protein